MNSGAGHVEALADKRRHRRDLVADFVLEIVSDLGNDRWIHSVQRAAHGSILKPYETGCKLQRKRVECAIMLQAAEAE